VLIVSFASAIGASLAFLSSRYLLRDWVNSKFGSRVKAIDRGIAKDGLSTADASPDPGLPLLPDQPGDGADCDAAATFYIVSQSACFRHRRLR
jgi:hypothetical protein